MQLSCCCFCLFVAVFLFLLRIRPPQGAAIFVRSLPMKTRKRLAEDVMYTFAVHAGFIQDVTDLVKSTSITAARARVCCVVLCCVVCCVCVCVSARVCVFDIGG